MYLLHLLFSFLHGFLGCNGCSNNSKDLNYNGETFITFSDSEDNDEAIELVHQTAIRFCEEARGDDDDDVNQCLLALYCSVEAVEDDDSVFDILKDANLDSTGVKSKNCTYEKFEDSDTFS